MSLDDGFLAVDVVVVVADSFIEEDDVVWILDSLDVLGDKGIGKSQKQQGKH